MWIKKKIRMKLKRGKMCPNSIQPLPYRTPAGGEGRCGGEVYYTESLLRMTFQKSHFKSHETFPGVTSVTNVLRKSLKPKKRLKKQRNCLTESPSPPIHSLPPIMQMPPPHSFSAVYSRLHSDVNQTVVKSQMPPRNRAGLWGSDKVTLDLTGNIKV